MKMVLALTAALTAAILVVLFPLWNVRYGTSVTVLMSFLLVAGVALYVIRGWLIGHMSERRNK